MSQQENTVPDKLNREFVSAEEFNQIKNVQNNNAQDSFSKADGGEILGIVTVGPNSELIVKRLDGTIAGIIKGDDPDNFGFGIIGKDGEDNFTNVVLAGSNVYIGRDSLYMANNSALTHGYLKLGGAPVLDPNGNEFWPVQFQQIEQELYNDVYTDANDYPLSETPVVILDAGVMTRAYTDPADYSYSFRLQESGARSTEIQFWFEVDGVETERNTWTVAAGQIVTVTGGQQIIDGITTGQTLQMFAVALDTGQGRVTSIVGTDAPTTVELRQLGYGASIESGISVIQGAGIEEVWQPYGSVITFDTSVNPIIGQISPASDKFGKEFVAKRISGGDNELKLIPATGEFIDGISDARGLVLGNQWDSVRLVSDGTNWLITGRDTHALSTIRRATEITIPATTSFQPLNIFDIEVYRTTGIVVPNISTGEISIANIENSMDLFELKFNATFEFTNNRDVTFAMFIDGIETDYQVSELARGPGKTVTISASSDFEQSTPSTVSIHYKAEVAANLKVLKSSLSIERIGK